MVITVLIVYQRGQNVLLPPFAKRISLRKQASKKDFMRRPCHSSRISEQEEEMGLAN